LPSIFSAIANAEGVEGRTVLKTRLRDTAAQRGINNYKDNYVSGLEYQTGNIGGTHQTAFQAHCAPPVHTSGYKRINWKIRKHIKT
jgi:hypothetical protein